MTLWILCCTSPAFCIGIQFGRILILLPVQTEDDAVDGGPHVAATALQPTATAGQTGHRPRRAATAVAVRQTVPPRKPAVAAAAKAKPAPASAPPEVTLSNLLAKLLAKCTVQGLG